MRFSLSNREQPLRARSYGSIPSFPLVTALIVDDDQNSLRALRLVLEAEAVGVLAADNAEAAVTIAISERPDVVVTDYMMPGIDGLELCRRLKANPVTVDIPVVMLTAAYPLPSAAELSCHALLRKPVSVANLLSTLGALLAGTGPTAPASEQKPVDQ